MEIRPFSCSADHIMILSRGVMSDRLKVSPSRREPPSACENALEHVSACETAMSPWRTCKGVKVCKRARISV